MFYLCEAIHLQPGSSSTSTSTSSAFCKAVTAEHFWPNAASTQQKEHLLWLYLTRTSSTDLLVSLASNRNRRCLFQMGNTILLELLGPTGWKEVITQKQRIKNEQMTNKKKQHYKNDLNKYKKKNPACRDVPEKLTFCSKSCCWPFSPPQTKLHINRLHQHVQLK